MGIGTWKFIEGLLLELMMFTFGAFIGTVITSIVYESEIKKESENKKDSE